LKLIHSFFKKSIWSLLLISVLAQAQYKAIDPADEDDPNAPRVWTETEGKIPETAPSNELKPFFVSGNTPLTFAIDATSLTVGKDDVIRYVLVITSPSGAKQVNYEGLRCEKYEWRLYATLQGEGKWVKNPNSHWQEIKGNTYNRYHSALVQDAFCENSSPRRNPKEILRLLKP
jgi:CNP1-like family